MWQGKSGAYLDMTGDEFVTDGRKVESVSFMYKIGLYIWTGGGIQFNVSFTLQVNSQIFAVTDA